MQNKQTILFDFDGTLADTLRQIFHISNKLAGIYGYKKVAEEEIEHYRQMKTREALRNLQIPILQMPRIAIQVKKELQKEMHLIQPISYIKEATAQLHKKFKLGIVTSNSAENVNLFIETNEMHWFDIIHTGSNIFGKSRVLKNLLKENQLLADEVVYVGDEIRDIEAAQKIGIDMIAVSWGINSAETLTRQNPTYLIHHPLEILTLLCPDKNI